ncbi:MAG: AAA family ATPase [Anaerolineae bacterium]|nr:AAA family ATPase [Anaerolineae bacterium]MDW8098761.1 AAA family ATPase [Anaerolineae bacterium]
MTTIYAFANQKGGVGKTTTVVNVGAYLAAAGYRVLLVDIDPQANATSSLGIVLSHSARSVYHALMGDTSLAEVIVSTKRPRLMVAPATPALAGAEVEMVEIAGRERLLARALSPVMAGFDFILIDSPPSLGLLTVNGLVAAQDGVIIPVQCEYLALEGLTRLLETIRLVRERLNPQLRIAGMVLTMYDARTNLSQQVVDEMRRHFPQQTFATVIPRNVRLGEAPSYGEPILTYAPSSAGAIAYAALTQEILARAGRLDTCESLPTSPEVLSQGGER